MSVCDMCTFCNIHEKNKDRKCTFSGNCIVNTYNLHGTGTLDSFVNPKVEAVAEEAPVVEKEEIVIDPNFNPFQRGNGCMLSDLVKTR